MNGVVNSKQIRWAIIQKRLRNEGIKLTIKRKIDSNTELYSGMGRINGQDYRFRLFENGTGILNLPLPKTQKQREVIKRLVTMISEVENDRFSSFPIFGKRIPGLDMAVERITSIAKKNPNPRPNLCMEIPECNRIVLDWGCPNLEVMEEAVRRIFPLAKTIEL